MSETFHRNIANVEALVFDLDGTLIDSKRDLVQSVNATLRNIDRPELPETLIASYVGSGAPVLIRRALGGAPEPEELQNALAFFLDHYEKHKLDFTREYPGVRATLESLRAVPMAVLTNKPVKISVQILEGLKLARNAGMISAIVNYGFGTHDRDMFPADIYLDRMEELLPLVTNGSR